VADVLFRVDIHVAKNSHCLVGRDFNFKGRFDGGFILPLATLHSL
jgi:hypothetical protein